jgi:hypothetical protein
MHNTRIREALQMLLESRGRAGRRTVGGPARYLGCGAWQEKTYRERVGIHKSPTLLVLVKEVTMRVGERIALLVLWAVILVVVGGAITYAFVQALDNVTKLAVSVVGVGGVIVGAIVSHSLTIMREQEAERRRLMQQNYLVLLDRVCKYVRSNRKDEDAFDGAHLYSWIVGTPRVIGDTVAFMDNPDGKTLRYLLLTMREDIGLPTRDLESIQLKVLQPLNAPGSLGAVSART